MFAGRPAKAVALSLAAVLCGVSAFVLAGTAFGGTGPGASGNTITNALQAQSPFSPGTLDSGQPVDVVIPANTVLTPGATIFIFECAAPSGVDPTSTAACDGNTNYAGGTISVQSDGSVDVINTSTNSGLPYIMYALPDQVTLSENSSGSPKCGLGSADECVLYIGQGGGSDTGFSQPHFFSQAFQVHPDPTDSGTLNPGDGTFPADSAPAITSANHTTFTKGTAGTFSVTATGYGPPTFTETGSLPAGVTLKTTFSGNSSTGVLAGTPTQSGSFPITINADNGVGTPATQSFTLTVNAAPAITSANHVTFTQGTAGSFTVTATGSPAPTLAESGTLPAGVTFTPGTGVLAGTPTATGTFPITFTATNGVGSPANQSFTLTVSNSGTAPAITSANNTTFTEGTAGTFTVTATGSPKPTLAESGTLPAGVSFTPGTGVLAGTPTATGTFPITFTATNGVGSPATQSFTLSVLGFHISTTSLPNGTVGVPYSVQLQTLGGTGPYKWKKTAKLPTGLSISSTGLLSGTPSSKAVGTQSVGVTVTSNKTSTASATLPLTVDEAPVITSSNAVSFDDNTASSFTATSTGFPAPSYTETGALPTGVTLSSAGVLSGTPVLPGSPANTTVFPITIRANNGIGSPGSQSFSLTVFAPLVITTTSLPSGAPGAAYSGQLAAAGGLTPYKWKKLSSLPKGLKLNAATGAITGTLSTKAAPSTNPITVEVTCKEGKVKVAASKTLTIVVS